MQKVLTVFIVDDDEDDKEMFCEVISEIRLSISCLSAQNGQEALQLLQDSLTLPGFIFLDLNMPRMNGKQFLAELKKIEKLSSIPVIIYSTSKSEKDREETRQLGSMHFLTKPSSTKQLQKELEFVLEKKYENVLNDSDVSLNLR